MQIQGNVFIITGGASGLGAATARMLAKAGGKVVIADVQVEQGQGCCRSRCYLQFPQGNCFGCRDYFRRQW